MKVVYGLTHFKSPNKKPVVAIGVFDGLHLGHRRIIAALLKEAKRRKTLSLILTFFPHPQKESSLYSLPHRLKLLKETGVDLCLVIRFSPVFRSITATEFLKKVIIKKINPAAVIIGKNFSFGRHAQGNWQMLKVFSKKAGFRLRVIDVLGYNNISISSSYIRTLIRNGRLNRARQLLGRPVSILGKVSKGSGLARILGYPTANVDPDHEVFPPSGVYAVRLRIVHKYLGGVCYIGRKPTLKKRGGEIAIEVHIFNFKDSLYGRRVQIEFVGKIRSEKKFNSIQNLARQIKSDIKNCHNKFRL